jgi:hypothetical protein
VGGVGGGRATSPSATSTATSTSMPTAAGAAGPTTRSWRARSLAWTTAAVVGSMYYCPAAGMLALRLGRLQLLSLRRRLL